MPADLTTNTDRESIHSAPETQKQWLKILLDTGLHPNEISYLDPRSIFNQVPERFYKPDTDTDPEHTIMDLLSEHDEVTITLDFGTFTVRQAGYEVEVQTDDQSVINTFNATKLAPYGVRAMLDEFNGSRFGQKPTIVPEAVDLWMQTSEDVVHYPPVIEVADA